MRATLVGHGLHAASAAFYEAGALGSGQPLISVRFRWAELANLPRPRRTETAGRDRMYEACVAGRPLTDPLDAAYEWFAELSKSAAEAAEPPAS
jgi:hypothetical protein